MTDTKGDVLREAAETVLESYSGHCMKNGLSEPGCLDELRAALSQEDAVREAQVTDDDVYDLSVLLVPERPTASQEHRIRTVMNAIFKRMLRAALAHGDLTRDTPTGECTNCGRKTWAAQDRNTRCEMLQPDETRCDGILLGPVSVPATDGADE